MLSVLPQAMDLTNVLNNRGANFAQHPHHFTDDFMNQQHHLAFGKPEPDMDRPASPHLSEHPAYPTHNMPRSYHSPGVMQAPMHIPSSMPMAVQGFPDMQQHMAAVQNMGMPHMAPATPTDDGKKQKTHQCSTCDSAFARRSDLSRHGTSLAMRTTKHLVLSQPHPFQLANTAF